MEEAEAAYRAALDVNPADAETHCNLGLLLGELDRLDEARACYATAIALKPSYAVPHYALGSLLYRQGDAAAAVTSFRRAVKSFPRPRRGLA